jgi:hypothetical protein
MRKLVLFCLLLLQVFFSHAQQKYRCAFRETTVSTIPDSLFRFLAAKGTNLSSEEVGKFLEQQRTDPVSWYNLKIVIAGKDQTYVSRDIYSVSGKDTIKTRDSFLYKNDEIYNSARSRTGFSDKPWDYPKKIFKSTGGKDTIMNYQCEGYISTDSTCFIWVTDELPDYINPGIRKSNVKGAVLAFRLIRPETDTKSIMVKLDKIL